MSHYVKIKRGTTPNIGLCTAEIRTSRVFAWPRGSRTAVVTEEGKKQAY